MRRLLKLSAILLLVCVVGILITINTGSSLPEDTDAIIEQVLQNELPEFFSGEAGYANSNGIKIWYEIQRPKTNTKGTIVLLMGAAGTATFWPDYVVQPLVEKGYQVIRFDYRGTGMSDWIEDWSEQTAYSIHDMTKDIIAILDQQNINQAHIVGMSMGGAIAREFAIEYPKRTASLSMMVSTGVFHHAKTTAVNSLPGLDMLRLLLRHGIWSNERDQAKFILGVMHIMNADSPESINNKLIIQQALYELRKRRGFHAAALRQHFYAIKQHEELNPTPKPFAQAVLYVVGEKDPIISLALVKQQLKHELQSKLVVLPDVAHIIPESRVNEVIQALDGHMQAVSHF